jgi:hypothetical protein
VANVLEQPVRIETYGACERLRQPIAANDDTYFSRTPYQLAKASGTSSAMMFRS